MVKLTVRRRIVLLLLIVSLVPLAIANEIWLISSQTQLRKDAAAQQELLVKGSADDVSYFINNKVNSAIIHSQSSDVQNMQLPEAQAELSAYLNQDPDLAQVSLVDAKGDQRLLVSPGSTSSKVVDVSSSDAFRVVTFLGGEDYISPVSFDASHNAFVTISVPLTSYASTLSGDYLSTSKPGAILAPSAVKGALIVKVALNQLWNSVLNYKLGQSGFAYVVDDQGNLIAHPKGSFSARHTNLADTQEVKTALAVTLNPGAAIPEPRPHQTVSETGVPVLSSHYPVPRTGWIVVAEEPIESVYAPANNDVRVAGVFFALSFLVGLALITLTASSLLRPIKALSEGAEKFASGNLDYRIHLSRQDEFGSLAQTFNNMATKLSANISKLQGLDQLKNEFIAIASHNLRTPLSVINGSVNVLQKSPVTPESRKLINNIEKGANELSGFSENLLAISSIEAGSATVQVSDIPVGELMKPLQIQFSAVVAEKGLRIKWSFPKPDTNVHLSPVHIRSAISHLLSNAIHFTPTGGQVECSFTILPQQYELRVTDSGNGIDPAEMEKLFTMFHRGTSTLQYDHPGTGIGLYLTMLIVDAHHGHITVRSQLGKGSTFTITLPAPDLSKQTQT